MKNLVRLTNIELQKLAQGELVFIEHPEKGICKVDIKEVYVATL